MKITSAKNPKLTRHAELTLRGKTIPEKFLVFGGSRGLGKAIVSLLLGRGAEVVVVSRNLPSEVIQATHWSCDLLKIQNLTETLEKIQETHAPFQGVVFSARFRGKPVDAAGFHKMDLEACHQILKYCPRLLRVGKPGSVVLIGSTATRGVAPEQSPEYHVAKAGLLGLMRYYAFSLAHKGIRVNVVSPGTFQKQDWPGPTFSRRLHRIRKANPSGRLGHDREIAEVCSFLLEKRSSWINGQEIVVDGGAGLLCNESFADVAYCKIRSTQK